MTANQWRSRARELRRIVKNPKITSEDKIEAMRLLFWYRHGGRHSQQAQSIYRKMMIVSAMHRA